MSDRTSPSDDAGVVRACVHTLLPPSRRRRVEYTGSERERQVDVLPVGYLRALLHFTGVPTVKFFLTHHLDLVRHLSFPVSKPVPTLALSGPGVLLPSVVPP